MEVLLSVFLLFFLFALWFYLKYLIPVRPKEGGYEYVYVKKDGRVREVTNEERKHLEADYLPGDGDRPYVKSSYLDKNGWGHISGYIRRRRVPKRISIENELHSE